MCFLLNFIIHHVWDDDDGSFDAGGGDSEYKDQPGLISKVTLSIFSMPVSLPSSGSRLQCRRSGRRMTFLFKRRQNVSFLFFNTPHVDIFSITAPPIEPLALKGGDWPYLLKAALQGFRLPLLSVVNIKTHHTSGVCCPVHTWNVSAAVYSMFKLFIGWEDKILPLWVCAMDGMKLYLSWTLAKMFTRQSGTQCLFRWKKKG